MGGYTWSQLFGFGGAYDGFEGTLLGKLVLDSNARSLGGELDAELDAELESR